jgi:hypothetical protein
MLTVPDCIVGLFLESGPPTAHAFCFYPSGTPTYFIFFWWGGACLPQTNATLLGGPFLGGVPVCLSVSGCVLCVSADAQISASAQIHVPICDWDPPPGLRVFDLLVENTAQGEQI